MIGGGADAPVAAFSGPFDSGRLLLKRRGTPCYVSFPPAEVCPFIRQVGGDNATLLIPASYHDRSCESHKGDAIAPLVILPDADSKA
jgi:hypothetical protein